MKRLSRKLFALPALLAGLAIGFSSLSLVSCGDAGDPTNEEKENSNPGQKNPGQTEKTVKTAAEILSAAKAGDVVDFSTVTLEEGKKYTVSKSITLKNADLKKGTLIVDAENVTLDGLKNGSIALAKNAGKTTIKNSTDIENLSVSEEEASVVASRAAAATANTTLIIKDVKVKYVVSKRANFTVIIKGATTISAVVAKDETLSVKVASDTVVIEKKTEDVKIEAATKEDLDEGEELTVTEEAVAKIEEKADILTEEEVTEIEKSAGEAESKPEPEEKEPEKKDTDEPEKKDTDEPEKKEKIEEAAEPVYKTNIPFEIKGNLDKFTEKEYNNFFTFEAIPENDPSGKIGIKVTYKIPQNSYRENPDNRPKVSINGYMCTPNPTIKYTRNEKHWVQNIGEDGVITYEEKEVPVTDYRYPDDELVFYCPLVDPSGLTEINAAIGWDPRIEAVYRLNTKTGLPVKSPDSYKENYNNWDPCEEDRITEDGLIITVHDTKGSDLIPSSAKNIIARLETYYARDVEPQKRWERWIENGKECYNQTWNSAIDKKVESPANDVSFNKKDFSYISVFEDGFDKRFCNFFYKFELEDYDNYEFRLPGISSSFFDRKGEKTPLGNNWSYYMDNRWREAEVITFAEGSSDKKVVFKISDSKNSYDLCETQIKRNLTDEDKVVPGKRYLVTYTVTYPKASDLWLHGMWSSEMWYESDTDTGLDRSIENDDGTVTKTCYYDLDLTAAAKQGITSFTWPVLIFRTYSKDGTYTIEDLQIKEVTDEDLTE